VLYPITIMWLIPVTSHDHTPPLPFNHMIRINHSVATLSYCLQCFPSITPKHNQMTIIIASILFIHPWLLPVLQPAIVIIIIFTCTQLECIIEDLWSAGLCTGWRKGEGGGIIILCVNFFPKVGLWSRLFLQVGGMSFVKKLPLCQSPLSQPFNNSMVSWPAMSPLVQSSVPASPVFSPAGRPVNQLRKVASRLTFGEGVATWTPLSQNTSTCHLCPPFSRTFNPHRPSHIQTRTNKH